MNWLKPRLLALLASTLCLLVIGSVTGDLETIWLGLLSQGWYDVAALDHKKGTDHVSFWIGWLYSHCRKPASVASSDLVKPGEECILLYEDAKGRRQFSLSVETQWPHLDDF